MTSRRIPLLTLLLAVPGAHLAGQVLDSTVNPPLAWTLYTGQQWSRIAASLPTRSDSGPVQVTLPQVQGRFIVVYGRVAMPIIQQEAIGWVRQVASELWLYLSSTQIGQEGSRLVRIDVFAAHIGPLQPGRYRVHVIWLGRYGQWPMVEDSLWDETIVVP